MLPRRWFCHLRQSRLQYTILLFFGHLAFVSFASFVVVLSRICLSFPSQGLVNGTYPPTLVDLEYLHSINDPSVTMKDISLLLTYFCSGVLAGSFSKFSFSV